MLSKEFAEKLTAAFKDINDRIGALEHSVNEVLIKGLEDASAEYDDDCKFSEFSDTYKDKFASVDAPVKVLYGEDFDLPSAIYEQLKEVEGYGTDDFDEAGHIDAIIEEIESKIKALQDLKEEVKEEAEDSSDKPSESESASESAESEDTSKSDSDDEDIPSEEQLAKEFEEYAHNN